VLEAIVKSKQEGARLAAEQAQALASAAQLVALVLLVLGLLLSVGFGWLVGASIRLPLQDLRRSVEDLAAGRLDIVVPHTGQTHEIGAMADAIAVLQQGAHAKAEQDWIKHHLAAVDSATLTAASYREFGDRLGSCLAPVLGLRYAALYVPDATGVQRAGGYGCDDRVHPPHFAWGEGLVGQAAKDQRTTALSVPAQQPVGATLGMGLLQTRHVQVWAVSGRDALLAVLEIGAEAPLNSQQLALVEVLLPSMASRLTILAGTVATRALLDQMQGRSDRVLAEPNQQGAVV
jgi:HAMP domain-containing protein